MLVGQYAGSAQPRHDCIAKVAKRVDILLSCLFDVIKNASVLHVACGNQLFGHICAVRDKYICLYTVHSLSKMRKLLNSPHHIHHMLIYLKDVNIPTNVMVLGRCEV